MFLKLIALIAAAIPLFLFLRAVFGRRPSKLGAALREARKQIDLAIYIFLGIIGCVVAFALGKLAWAWWTSMS
jgi:multisubunit Na+/H+ antiporter MnhB subunit